MRNAPPAMSNPAIKAMVRTLMMLEILSDIPMSESSEVFVVCMLYHTMRLIVFNIGYYSVIFTGNIILLLPYSLSVSNKLVEAILFVICHSLVCKLTTLCPFLSVANDCEQLIHQFKQEAGKFAK